VHLGKQIEELFENCLQTGLTMAWLHSVSGLCLHYICVVAEHVCCSSAHACLWSTRSEWLTQWQWGWDGWIEDAMSLYCRLYLGIAPGWVYYFRPTIAAFAITGTNPYYWTLTDLRGGIMLNKCYNTITGTNPYSWTLTDPQGMRVCLMYQHAGTLTVPWTGIPSSKQAST